MSEQTSQIKVFKLKGVLDWIFKRNACHIHIQSRHKDATKTKYRNLQDLLSNCSRGSNYVITCDQVFFQNCWYISNCSPKHLRLPYELLLNGPTVSNVNKPQLDRSADRRNHTITQVAERHLLRKIMWKINTASRENRFQVFVFINVAFGSRSSTSLVNKCLNLCSVRCSRWQTSLTHTHDKAAEGHIDSYIKTHKFNKNTDAFTPLHACQKNYQLLFLLQTAASFFENQSKVPNGNKLYSPSVRIYHLDSDAACFISMQGRWEVAAFEPIIWSGGERHGLYSPTANHTKIFYYSIWSTSSKDSKTLTWFIRSEKYNDWFLCWNRPLIFKIHKRQGTKCSAESDESLHDVTAVKGRGARWLGLFWWTEERWGEATGASQPSIPKSSVNFLTFSRSSVLTVGRVVARERNMSDCRGKIHTLQIQDSVSKLSYFNTMNNAPKSLARLIFAPTMLTTLQKMLPVQN